MTYTETPCPDCGATISWCPDNPADNGSDAFFCRNCGWAA